MDMRRDGQSIKSEQPEKQLEQESVLVNKSKFSSAEHEIYLFAVHPLWWQELRRRSYLGGGDHPLFKQRCMELGIQIKE